MMTTITKHQVDLNQGRDKNEDTYGYVCGNEGGDDGDKEGGYFFTWHSTLEATLDSVEEDEVDGDGGLDIGDVIEFLREYLPTTRMGRRKWEVGE